MVEIPPIDELPKGVPGEAVEPCPGDFDHEGRFARGNKMAAAGGKAKGGNTTLAHRLGLRKLNDDAAFAPYKKAAVTFRRRQCTELARSVGSGLCGPGPSSIVATAALQLAASRYLFDLATSTGDATLFVQASRLGNDSRQNLAAAHALCALEAESRCTDPVGLDAARLAFQRSLAAEPVHGRVHDLVDVQGDQQVTERVLGPSTGQHGPIDDEVPK
jgi:hypothetical protein